MSNIRELSQLASVIRVDDETRNVGIGTTNPKEALTVVGVVSATSFYGDGSKLSGIIVSSSQESAGIGSTGSINTTGIITASAFYGNLTGTATTVTNIPNLSGDVSSVNTVTTLATVNSNIGTYGDVGAIPRVTVNAKGLVTGVTTVALNNGTLTLAVSGTGLSGSSTFTANQSGSSTFTVTSNATTDNTNNAIVARNSSGGFSAGIITATQFTTGSGTLGFTTNTISGPAELIIDPAAVGDNTGAVRIKGDLYVDGTQTIINSSTIELADFNVGIATTVGTNSILDGAGIGIGSTGIRKTITWNNTAGALTSSEDWNLASGKQYEINGTNVLNATTLGSGVVNSSLTSVGTLGQLNVSGVSTFTNGSVFIGSGTSTGTVSQRLQVTGGAYVSGNLGVGVTNPGAILDIRGNPWFSPNTTGIKATALRLGRFVDGVNAAYDILTDDSTGDDIEIQSNRYSGNVRISRGSPSGIQTAFQIYSHYQIGSYISIADTTGTTTKVQINEAGNTFFNNSGSVLIGTSSSTGTASQRLQVTGGAYVSGNLGVGVTNPVSRIDAYSPTSGSTAIRATSSSSFSTTLFPGVIAGLSTNASNAYASQFAASGIGVTSGEIGIYSFYPTFANFPADRGPRRAVDLVGGFSTGVWGTEYFSINVGKDGSANDSATLTNERLRIVGTGNLGIGTTNPTSRLQVQGDVRVVGVITCTDIDSTSDINLKTNIKPIDDPLTKVMQLNGVSFDWKETQQPSMGVIAQELEKVFPELVKQSDSHKSVNYNGLIGVLIEAIKEQQKQIEELKSLKN